jgi:hypothetical protein
VVAAALLGCGPPPATPTAGPADGAAAADGAVAGPPADGAVPASPADEPFRAVLAAVAGGSARAVRNFVPAGGRLLLYTNICRGPLGRVRCGEHEVDAERRRIDDELLASWQGVLVEAAAADPGFVPETQAVRCTESASSRWSCTTVLALGFTQCRGNYTATVDAVLVRDGDDWWLTRLGLVQEILVCD